MIDGTMRGFMASCVMAVMLFVAPQGRADVLTASQTVNSTQMITGTQSYVLPVLLPPGTIAGTVSVVLTDLGWPGLMSSLSFAMTTSTSLLAQMSAPGHMTFNIAGSGSYFATVYGVADPNFGNGLYSLNLSYAPVPIPAAAWLLCSGLALIGARKRSRKETVINAR